MIPFYLRVLNLVPKQYSGKWMVATEYSTKIMVPVFIVHARWGLLSRVALVVTVSVSRVPFRP
jgi:hypothetical protein